MIWFSDLIIGQPNVFLHKKIGVATFSSNNTKYYRANATHEIIGKSSVKTTHDHLNGAAAGVVQSFQNCLQENQSVQMMWFSWLTRQRKQRMH